MLRHNKLGFLRIGILGALVVTGILAVGTFFMGKMASHDTEDAVRNVSLLYLDELAGRREQVVASTLKTYINNLDLAVGMLTKEDLRSMEHLQAYQTRMKQLYDLEKFAFVDTEGIIYTSRGTRTDIDQYDFDYKTLSEPKISIKNIDGDSKKLVVAVPVDRLPLEEKKLVVCFMEMDMKHFIQNVSLQTDLNNTTFCNLYTFDGKSLTNTLLAGLTKENNLFQALTQAHFDDPDMLEAMRRHFMRHENGIISFAFNDVRITLAYEPVHNTNWILTYLIRESVITDKISSISDGIIKRNLLQSLLTVGVLLILFAIMLSQTQKATELAIHQKTAVQKQRELEQQIALQETLLKQEKRREQQDTLLSVLASNYRIVYYVDLDRNEGVCYRSDHTVVESITEQAPFAFQERLADYAARYVDPAYREDFLRFIKPKAIRDGLEKNPIIAFRYIIHRDGGERYELLRMACLHDKDELEAQGIHTVGVGFIDIDAEMRETLAKNQALADALKTAEEASKAKTIFLSSMSHEIRTPMNAIIGLDALALHEPGISESTRGYLEKIGSSAQHLLSMINDILDMSRIESGRMVIRNEEFVFAKLIEQINTIFSVQCQEKGLTYNCHVSGNLASYYIGDSTKLKQIFINILGNAVKFTNPGGTVDFLVDKKAEFDGKTTLCFTVRDTGIGMSAEYLPKIFDTFSQEDATAANKYGSSGLGMAITKNIVEMMNGKIEVASEKGVGTTFTVSITLLNSEKTTAEETTVALNPQEMTVLVIDDDPLACNHAKLVLEQMGIAAETALSGKEGLEMVKLRHARRDSYNLIIVDWQMPEMDGVATTRAMRQIIGTESAIIILTAYHWDDILDEAKEAGVDSFVAKPLFAATLHEELLAAQQKRLAAASQEVKKVSLQGRRILLAEDMEINAQIMLEVLKMREMETDWAENGKRAVELFASHPEGYYDAILMDMRMPEMTGLEATTAIRAMDRKDAKSIPIIALTANAFDEDVQRSLQAGLNAHLSKPVEPDVLFATLETAIPA